jgi:ADP-ribose pyrophosphatase YjhB (NUDIX family)
MRRAARAIIIHDGKLLVMHRNKFGTEYDTLPGGNVELGESLEQAALREVIEETSVQINNLRLVFVEEAGNPYGTQYIFLANYMSGEPKLHENSEEAHINKLGQNLYEPKWVELADLPKLPFVSEKLKQTIIQAYDSGFPDKPVEIR